MNRRHFVAIAASAALSSLAGKSALSQETTVTNLKPFRLAISAEDVAALGERLTKARWPVEVEPGNWGRGVPGDYLRQLADRWVSFDWSAHEQGINRFEQVLFTHEGQDMHAFHIRSAEPNAIPLVLLHGWPSSSLEYLKIFEPLTNPTAHGGKASDAFHVIAPTLPGFGLSPAPTTPGWNMGKIAGAVLDLVSSLGYDRFAVHGTDMGAGIAGELDTLAAGRVIGLHTGTDSDTAVAVASFMQEASLARTDLTEAQKATLRERFAGMADRNGYLAIQTSRPKTLGYALNDSPIGQLAWIAEKFAAWTDPKKPLIEDAVDLDQFFAIASTYWHGGGGAGSANALWESFRAMGWGAQTATPKGVIAFNSDALTRALIDPMKAVPHWTEYADGGHFPAMEHPDRLVADLRTFLAPLRA
nr:epoxide hydrolase family protein [uncultured Devosia sp.]